MAVCQLLEECAVTSLNIANNYFRKEGAMLVSAALKVSALQLFV